MRFVFLLAALTIQDPQDPSELRKKLAEVQARMAQVDQQVAALKKRRKGVLVELQAIGLQRDKARAQVEGARLRRDQAAGEVRRITQEQQRISEEMLKLQGDLKRQVRWIHALGPWGDVGLVQGIADLESFVVRGRLLEWRRIQERKRLQRIQALRGDLLARGKELGDVLGRLAREEQDGALMQASLKVTEGQLQDFLQKLAKDEDAQKQAQAELAEEALQLERMLAKLLGQPRAEPFIPTVRFADLKGDLPSPVEGTLAEGYGEQLHPKYRTKHERSGLLVEAEVGAKVAAVAAGKVIFAEPFQSYGPMVILDHGGGWFTIYQHLQGLVVAKGQVLQAGETVGTVGETVDGPRLGFEIRFQAKAEDPQKWMKRRYR